MSSSIVRSPSPNRRGLALVALILLTTVACAGEVYRWYDEQGRAHFSDRSAPGAERLTIKPSVPTTDTGAWLRVERVYDGDTLKLDNGEKVRLLGINTPEVGGGRKPEEAGGQRAREWLKAKLEGRRVRLEQDVEARDHYQRMLAHVFLEDGTHLNLALVEQGLAATDIHPPNLKYSEALGQAERRAERENKGLWALPEYRVKPVETLDAAALFGWQRVVGKVEALDVTKRQYRLRFAGGFEAHIPKASAHLFPELKSYLGQTLELRGWVSRNGEGYTMTIRHPAALVRPGQ